MTLMDAPDRLPPHHIQAEEAVLGSCLIDGETIEAVINTGMTARHFYRQRNRTIWDSLLRLRRNASPSNVVAVEADLVDKGELENAGGPAYLTHLLNATPTSVHAPYYAGIVRQAALQREAIKVAQDVAQMAYEAAEPDEIGQKLIEAGLSLSQNGKGGMLVQSSQLDIFNEITERYAERQVQGDIDTGFTAIDTKTGSMRRGNLVVVGARPSVGKSEFGFHLIRHAQMQDLNCALFSAEMSAEEIALRWVANDTGISLMQAQKMGDDERDALQPRIVDALGRFEDSGLLLTDTPALTSADIRAQCLSWSRSGKKIDLVVVDYLQLLRDRKDRGESNSDRIGRITQTLKLMARELNAVVILLSQLSRPHPETAKEPTMEDLRGSGDIEQDADKVLLLHSIDYFMRRQYKGFRPGQQHYNEAAKNVLFVNVAKNRMGPTWLTKLFYDPDRSMMRDLHEEAPQGTIKNY